jgi:ADP-heptose:LPS heptosyltransferase
MQSSFFSLLKISSFKNLLLKGFAKLSTLFPKHPENNERFLIVSTTGLGDTLWATPAIRALRYAYPHAYIGALTTPLGKEVFKNNPHLNEVFVLKKPILFSVIHLFSILRKKQIGTTLVFHTSQRIVLPLCAFIGSSQIIGSENMSKGLDFILTKTLKRMPTHEIQRRLDLVSLVGAKPVDFHMEVFLDHHDKNSAKKLLGNIPSHIPIIGMHPGAKDKFRQWPPDHFIALAKRLHDHLGCLIVLTGGASEKKLIQQMAQAAPSAVSFPEELPIHTLTALIQRLSLFIANDTGPMHLAFAVKTPTVALFCPSDPKLFGPYFVDKCSVIKKHHTCTPCLKKKCREAFCMRQIGIDEAFDQAINLIQRSR